MTNERGTYSDSFGILLTWELQVEVLKCRSRPIPSMLAI